MTRARALKEVIRARAAKTGERYTTARRHVLKDLQGAQRAQRAQGAQGAQGAQSAKTTKGGMSDAASIKKTGHDLAHWFAVLDRFGAVEKGHTDSARHLYEAHDVDGWYAQGITVAYERERGVRGMNQRCDGAFEVSASKVMNATTKQVVKAFSDARTRNKWINEAETMLADALAKGVANKKSKGFVVRPDGQARFRYKWNDTTVQLYMIPKSKEKISVVVQHTKLPSGDSVELYRGQWKTALGLLADHFSA
jgi:hypothetical protein